MARPLAYLLQLVAQAARRVRPSVALRALFALVLLALSAPVSTHAQTATPAAASGAVVLDGQDHSVCEKNEVTLTVSGTVELTNASGAWLQYKRVLLQPADLGGRSDSVLQRKAVANGERFSIEVRWPGIRPSDTSVQVNTTINLVDAAGNLLQPKGVQRTYFWSTNSSCNLNTPVPTSTPSPTASSVPTSTPSPVPPTSTPSPTASSVPTSTPSPVPPTSTPSPTASSVPTSTPSPVPPTSTPSPTASSVPTSTPSPVPPTSTPSPTASSIPTSTPSPVPPTSTPSPTASSVPTSTPSPVPPTSTAVPPARNPKPSPKLGPKPNRIFLPVVKSRQTMPDLVIKSARAGGGQLQLTIANQGDGAATVPFWLVVSVSQPPHSPYASQSWSDFGLIYMSWRIPAGKLPPGASLTVSTADSTAEGSQPFADYLKRSGVRFFAQVDAFNPASEFGAIVEIDELEGHSYNNATTFVSEASQLSKLGLPKQPRR